MGQGKFGGYGSVLKSARFEFQLYNPTQWKLSAATIEFTAGRPTVVELGRFFKQKYPEYTDMEDADLGRRARAKFPEYGDVVDVQPLTVAEPPPPEAKNRFVRRYQSSHQYCAPLSSCGFSVGLGTPSGLLPNWSFRLVGAKGHVPD